MANSKLKKYFPMIWEKMKLLNEIQSYPTLQALYNSWKPEQQEEFLDFCTGVRGMKILYDSFFKEILNPEYAPERLEYLLRTVLKRKVKILKVIPNDSTRIADEASLLITDIIVELEDGSIANVEIQKIGYSFPGARSACYSADMLLRQYKRVRSERNEQNKKFSYNDIKNTYLIVIFESSPAEFKKMPEAFFHHSKQVFDTGLELNLLQEYVMIPLDIFKNVMQNKSVTTPLEAWLTFLSEDDPEKIISLITKFPEFKPMYETAYQLCRNIERVMGLFSEELRELDRNTVMYMIEQQQLQLEEKDAQLEEKNAQLNKQAEEISNLKQALEQMHTMMNKNV